MTFWIGLSALVVLELFLFYDVHHTQRGAVHTQASIDTILHQKPGDWPSRIARLVAINMTALAWVAYLVMLDGISSRQAGGSPIRLRPHHFALLCLASIFIWCVFDFLNFGGGTLSWVYIGLPTRMSDKFLGYFFAFATIVPGMLLSGQVLLNTGMFNWARSRPWRMPRWANRLVLLTGMLMFAWPLLDRNTVTNLTLWTSLVFLLDPINDNFGRPSMFRDWQNGWYGRTLAAFAGGLICGLLWEFWNYWALTKWTYHLPFLGRWEQFRYFEMPVLGLLGFIPFGMECWVMWQTIRIGLDGLAEPLPDECSLL